MNYLDRAYLFLREWIAGYSADAATMIAVPVFAMTAVVLAVVMIRRLVPFTIKVLGVPILIVAIAIVGTVLLGLQLIAARLWRLFRARPPSFVYTAGDMTIAALSRTQHIRPGLGPALYRLETFSLGLVLIGVGVLLWRWNVMYCTRAGGTSCISPFGDSYSALVDFAASLRA